MLEVFVGVDCSRRKPGLTILTEKHVVYCGSLKTVARGAHCLDEIATFLEKQLQCCVILRSAIEGPSMNSESRKYDLGEAAGVAKLFLFRASGGLVEPVEVPPKQLKLYAAGNGAAEDLIHAVKTEWGYDTGKDDDAADSYALAHLARALHLGAGKRRCEFQVIHDILHPDPKKKSKVKHRRTKDNI